ncbi:MAG: YggS family pyridoxal phosphate-dependent enzyme [Planctomycetota bacterium]
MNEILKKNLQSIRERIDNAAQGSGRNGSDVKLIGVTKYVDVEETEALVEAGCYSLGENRPQKLWEKSDAMDHPEIEWHLIGHLQRNKVKRTIEVANLIHSVDSVRLLKEINKCSQEIGKTSQILLEFNLSGEEAKHGFVAEQLDAILDEISKFESVQVRGLMGMGGLKSDADQVRREFRKLREIRESASNLPSNVSLAELSMGMSGDFEIAIEEGATMVRVGSLLFEGT